LGPAAAVVGAMQATAAIQILLGKQPARQMLVMDLWAGRFKALSLDGAKRAECVTCGMRRFEFLENESMSRSTSLCGRDAIQVRPARGVRMNMEEVAARLEGVGEVERTAYLVRCRLRDQGGVNLTVFADGRAIIHGVTDAERARSIYARFVGS